ncbi:Methylthioribose-1-phosphate isomerase [Gammaproteobacteria bacterium]
MAKVFYPEMTPDRITADHAILWEEDRLQLLDQRLLPHTLRHLAYDSATATAEAIRHMVVRGAPAIGITAAYGAVLAARAAHARQGEDWRQGWQEELVVLASARPTAVNLSWALARMVRRADTLGPGDPTPALLAEAQAIHAEDIAANRRLGDWGAALLERPTSVITHCNAGGLATGGYGTALGVIRSAHRDGKIERVYADETRPWLQGARLTAWELHQDGIPVTLLSDHAAALRMARGGIGWVIVGADRIAANGDVANKIGTYGLAVLARYHGVRFMVAAPLSTLDLTLPDGSGIPIEERPGIEVTQCGGVPVAAPGVPAWNPVFDVTPAALVDALVTERGVVLVPNRERIANLMRSS